MQPSTVWEYDAYTVKGPAGDLGLVAGMNKLGLDGWEVIGWAAGPVKPGLAGKTQTWNLYLKRPARAVRAASIADMNAVIAEVTIPGA